MKRYKPSDIEPKWQKAWEQSKIYQATEDKSKPKKYILEFFPYPSGSSMHVGHVRNYTIGDAMSRFLRMAGYNVMHPMGWDAFGLPAENYAIKTGISPQKAVADNVEHFKKQLMQMGFSYDWTREINSTDPSYYKWTQWFFLLLLKKGLAYQKESLQWWCDTDKTVLANEQVEAGKCWRCGNEVTKKSLKQWFFKITDYADRLIDDLDDLDWSESIKAMQRNWIGKSSGAEVDFAVDGLDKKITVFTTRPDTLFGATFMVLAPEHTLVKEIMTGKQKQDVENYIKQASAKSDVERQEQSREKTGVFTGAYAVNPVNNEKIPVWIADYVLLGYGTGAIMAVPAHDERDNEFAKKYELPIVQVVLPHFVLDGISTPRTDVDTLVRDCVDAVITDGSGKYLYIEEPDGLRHFVGGGLEPGEDNLDALWREVCEESGYDKIVSTNEIVTISAIGFRRPKGINQLVRTTFYEVVVDKRSRVNNESDTSKHNSCWVDKGEVGDRINWEHHSYAWSVYFGTSAIWSGEGKLINSGEYNGLSSSEAREKIVADLYAKELGQEKVNYKIRDWLISRQRYWGAPIPIIHCQKCGVVPVPEKDLPVVLPEVKSYEPTGEGTSVLASVDDWVNADCPKCGGKAKRETDTMDGFACSSWYFLRFADPNNSEKPFDKDKVDFWLPVDTYIGGAEHAVMHLLYARMWTKVMFDEGLVNFKEPFMSLKNQGMIAAPDGRKMSKSYGNVIAPDDLIADGYGADCIRVMELFIGPWDQGVAWSIEGMGGCYRFLQRVWTLVQEFLEKDGIEKNKENIELLKVSNQAIKKVTEDIQNLSYNTAVSALMELVNSLYKIKAEDRFLSMEWRQVIESLLLMLAPFAPHISEELWNNLGHGESIHAESWPEWNKEYLVNDKMTIVVQVNGKVRAEIVVDSVASEEDIKAVALKNENVQKYIEGREVKKLIYVPGRLVSVVA